MSDLMNDIRVVEAGRGTSWWGHGWRTFTSSLGTWIAIMLIYIIIVTLISIVPFIGNLGHSLLSPVFVGGLMLGCHAIARDQPLKVAHLFEGFQATYFVPLLIIGLVNIAFTLLLSGVMGDSVFGGGGITDLMRYDSANPLAMMSQSAGAIGFAGVSRSLAALVIAAVMGSLNWFAPALVVLHGAKPIDAMKTSFVATWRNWLPFLIYGLIALAVGVVVIIVGGVLALIFGLSLFAGSGILGMIGVAILALLTVGLLALVVGPIVVGSTYASYSDTFAEADADDTGNPAFR